MEKIKIGMFIATRRREKNTTQEQLAEMLGITNKSISKWKMEFVCRMLRYTSLYAQYWI